MSVVVAEVATGGWQGVAMVDMFNFTSMTCYTHQVSLHGKYFLSLIVFFILGPYLQLGRRDINARIRIIVCYGDGHTLCRKYGLGPDLSNVYFNVHLFDYLFTRLWVSLPA